MARIGIPLDNLKMFPDLELELITGDRVHLPDATEDRFGVVLFYREAGDHTAISSWLILSPHSMR